MDTINGFDFIRLHFDAEGALEHQPELDELKQRAPQATDAVLIAHGFRNDENDATGLYSRFLLTFRQHIATAFGAALGQRRFIVAGVYWPSKAFSEDVRFDGSTASLDDEIAEKEEARAKLRDLRDTIACAEQ